MATMQSICPLFRDTDMQIVFLLWPLLLLPVLAAWLTRPRCNAAPAPATKKKTTASAIANVARRRAPEAAPAYGAEAQAVYLDMLVTAANERSRASPAYRQAAHAAYKEIQNMEEDDFPTNADKA